MCKVYQCVYCPYIIFTHIWLYLHIHTHRKIKDNITGSHGHRFAQLQGVFFAQWGQSSTGSERSDIGWQEPRTRQKTETETRQMGISLRPPQKTVFRISKATKNKLFKGKSTTNPPVSVAVHELLLNRAVHQLTPQLPKSTLQESSRL